MQQIQNSEYRLQIEDEGGLLDILVIVAENVKLLVFGPLMVALMAVGATYITPPVYESVAILKTEPQIPTQAINISALATSTTVLDAAAVSLAPLQNSSPETLRKELPTLVRAEVGRGNLVKIAVSGPTAQQAQATAVAVLKQIYIQNKPKGSERSRLEALLAESRKRATIAEKASAQLGVLSAPNAALPAPGDLVRSYTELLDTMMAAHSQVYALEAMLEGIDEAQLIQPPTLPSTAKSRRGFLALSTALGTLFAFLVFVFIRHAFRNAIARPGSAAKLDRIRRAIGFGRKRPV